jgi:hypothetical protein
MHPPELSSLAGSLAQRQRVSLMESLHGTLSRGVVLQSIDFTEDSLKKAGVDRGRG